MRNQQLTAYSLHHKAYQDKRSLYYLFTKELGIIHGIGKKGVPQFVPLSLFASGKRSLKTLQQITTSHMVDTLMGQQQYAALYLNEIVLKLLPTEDPLPQLFDIYCDTLNQLRQPLNSVQLRLILRLFEKTLFEQIGYGVDFYQDIHGQSIEPDNIYQYVVDSGWHPNDSPASSLSQPYKSTAAVPIQTNTTPSKTSATTSSTIDAILGSTIITMQQGIDTHNLAIFSALHKQLIDHLFDYKPLQSRLLWQQFMQYQ